MKLDGPSVRTPSDFKMFLLNDKNKEQSCQLMKKVWCSADAIPQLQKCSTAILIVEGKAYSFKCSDEEVNVEEIFSLCSNQEESDTRFILYVAYAKLLVFESVVVRSPDIDVFFILLYHSNYIDITIYLDTGTGKKRILINVSEMAKELGVVWCMVLLAIYVFTGEDCVSAFKGKGKVTPLKKLMKNPKFHDAFGKLGDEWTVPDDIINKLEMFVCLMYGYGRETSANTVRAKMLEKMVGDDDGLTSKSKVDLSRLPP